MGLHVQGITFLQFWTIFHKNCNELQLNKLNELHGFGYEKPIKIAQYADDGILFLNNSFKYS